MDPDWAQYRGDSRCDVWSGNCSILSTMTKYLFLLTLLSLMGCAAKRSSCTSYKVAPKYAAAATSAFAKWSAFSDHTVTVDSDSVCEVREITADEYTRFQQEMGISYFAVHDPDTGNILLAPKQWTVDEYCNDGACVESILMHEIGHEYGLDHVEDPEAVMGTTNPIPRTSYNDSDRKELNDRR